MPPAPKPTCKTCSHWLPEPSAPGLGTCTRLRFSYEQMLRDERLKAGWRDDAAQDNVRARAKADGFVVVSGDSPPGSTLLLTGADEFCSRFAKVQVPVEIPATTP